MAIKINLVNPKKFKAHRSGWAFVISQLMRFHSNRGLIFDDFIDITFGYNRDQNLLNKTIPYKKPWIGVLHHPPHICPWYAENYKSRIDIHTFLNEPEFLLSIDKCECLIVLSEYLKNYLRNNFKQLDNTPIIVLKHPTEPGDLLWDYNKFKKSSNTYGMKILNIGYFLRNMSSIYMFKANRKLDKYLMPSDIRYGLNNLTREIDYKKIKVDKQSIKILNWQSNQFYDKLLEQSIVFLDLYDTSCNNAIIESIIRQTPLLINRHPAIEEYLGKDYPLYYSHSNEISDLIRNDKIIAAHEYLKNHPQYFAYLNPHYFVDDFSTQLTKTLSIGSTKKHQTPQITYKYNRTLFLTQPTKFNHRYGWAQVTKALNTFCKQHNNSINNDNNKLYFNNFLEHTFRNDNDNLKLVNINNKNHIASRGYNLFTANNTDIIEIDNSLYEWRSNTWAPVEKTSNLHQSCDIGRITNYQNNPWMGILHNPTKMPIWFDYNQNIYSLLQNSDFISSLTNCKCLIVLSKHLKNELHDIFKQKNIDVPIVYTPHPIPEVKQKFNFKTFEKRPRIAQIGYWLRNMHSFWSLSTNVEKIWLYGDMFASKMFNLEHLSLPASKSILSNESAQSVYNAINSMQTQTIDGVTVAKVTDHEYDRLLCSSIVFINLYSASANNAVLECLSTHTPILVNKLDPIIEYLGKDYPLYYSSIEEAIDLTNDYQKIQLANKYLANRYIQLENKFSLNSFISFIDQTIQKYYAKNN